MEEAGLVATDGSTSGFKLNTDFEEVAKYLKCPVCYEFVLPPIVLCQNGHYVCKSCKDVTTNKCPVCKYRVSPVRTLFSESLLELCTVRCKYYELGCDEWRPGRSLCSHQDTCPYRPINCRTCGMQVLYHKYLEHLQNEEKLKPHIRSYHGAYDIAVSGLPRGIDSFVVWESIWLKAFSEDFVCFLQFSKSNWWLWICAYASEEECEQYCCAITVWNMDTTIEVKYVGKVNPIRADSEEIFNSGKCLVVPDIQLQNLLSNGKLNVAVCVGMDYRNLEDGGPYVLDEEASALMEVSDEDQTRRLPVVSVGNTRHVTQRITRL